MKDPYADYPDGRHKMDVGLYLEVRNGGRAKSWLLITTKNGRRRTFGLGSAKLISFAQAKSKAKEFRAKVALGLDPLRPANAVQEPKTLRKAAEDAIKSRAEVKQWKNPERGIKRWTGVLERHVFPKFGRRYIDEIDREEMLSFLKPIWLSKPVIGQEIRLILEVIFDYAIRRGWRTAENPLRWKGWLEFELPPISSFHQVKHHEAMTVEEAAELWKEYRKADDVYARAILFGILTAARKNEFGNAQWSEIDMEKGVWMIPPERRKDKKQIPFPVPLSRQALSLLKTMRPRVKGPVFRRPTDGKTVIDLGWLGKRIAEMVGRRVTVHGCRSTFRDWCAESGKDPIVAEKCLMHSTGTTVERAYQRSTLFEQRARLMQQWADVIAPEGKTAKKETEEPEDEA